ncbi:MAG: hypothetical protein V1874_00350 [Spirochaetota bacterium]
MANNLVTTRNNPKLFFIILVLLLTGCLSYSYRGLVGVDSLPDKSVIGISYKDLVVRYGTPERIIPFNQVKPINMISTGEVNKFPDKELGNNKSYDFMATYNFNASYDILLYYRDRGYTYTFLIKDGIVISLTSMLTNKSDGIGIRAGGSMGVMGMGAAGVGLMSSKE